MAHRDRDYENYLFSQGKTIKQVRNLGSKVHHHHSDVHHSDVHTERKPIAKKVICDYCNKPVSQAYYNTHLVTDKHLENVERYMDQEKVPKKQKEVQKKPKEKEKEKPKKKKQVKEVVEESGSEKSESEQEQEQEEVIAESSNTDTESEQIYPLK